MLFFLSTNKWNHRGLAHFNNFSYFSLKVLKFIEFINSVNLKNIRRLMFVFSCYNRKHDLKGYVICLSVYEAQLKTRPLTSDQHVARHWARGSRPGRYNVQPRSPELHRARRSKHQHCRHQRNQQSGRDVSITSQVLPIVTFTALSQECGCHASRAYFR